MKTKAGWTPGPWEVIERTDCFEMVSGGTVPVMVCALSKKYPMEPEEIRLIQHAPEMAELLERIAAGVVEVRDTDNPANNFHACSAARALLAKVKGESNA